MHKIFQNLFLFEKFEIQTKLSKQEVLKKIDFFLTHEYTDYYGRISDNDFFIAGKNRKHYTGGFSRNSFAPIAKATVTQKEDITVISGVLRMNLLVLIIFIPIYLLSLLLIFPFPFMLVILHFCFFKPAKRLKEALEVFLR
jgi:hypothetical protein